MSADAEVRKASERFYDALSRMASGEKGTMADVWVQGPDVIAMHPIGGRQEGWGDVGASFDGVASIAAPGGQIRLEEQLLHVAGDVAWEVGVERGHAMLGGERVEVGGRVTNIYRRNGGVWKLVHHHADESPPMVDLLRRMQADE